MFLQKIKEKIGIDKAILYTLLGRGLQISTSLFSILFIAKYISPEEQGYYYTFVSIVALQVFFELGLTGVITQFVAHEVSHLQWSSQVEIDGDQKYKSRLSSLLHFCIKWYVIFAGFLLVSLLIVGLYFFRKYDVSNIEITWTVPWGLLVIGTTLNFLLAPILAFIEGLGKVKEIAKFRMIQQIIQPIILWGGLALGAKLFVSGLDAIFRVFIICIILYKSPFFKLLKNIWNFKITEKVNYMKEIFPFQWKIALSWVSGYLIFQLFNPVLFATEGALIAGQMGLTMAALNGLQALTQSWINTKVPAFSMLIAKKQYRELDEIFFKTMKQMIFIGTFILIIFVLIIFGIQKFQIQFWGIDIGNRFLPILPLCLMAWAIFTMFPINSWATYLRCHKKEPLLVSSIVVAVLSCISTVLFANLYGVIGMTIGFACLRLVSITWIYLIFKKKKIEWHGV